MNSKTGRIQAMITSCADGALDAHYVGFFECFNQQLYFESHEVLEQLWLKSRGTPVSDFYRGLIQLAGAFVHLQKGRPGPAGALFRKAEANLRRYPDIHEQLDVAAVLGLIAEWLDRLKEVGVNDSFGSWTAPRLELLSNGNSGGR